MPRSVPTMTTDEEAEAFLDQHPSDLDFAAFRPLTWEAAPKTARVNTRLARSPSSTPRRPAPTSAASPASA